MDRKTTTKTLNDLLAGLADGELDFRDQPDLLAKLAEDPKAGLRIAAQQRLRQAVGRAMDGPEMKCPEALAGKLLAMAGDGAHAASHATSQSTTPHATKPSPKPVAGPYVGPPVIARIVGRWAPAAVAAVLLLAAGVLFTQTQATGSGINTQSAAFLSTDQIRGFSSRHIDCAEKPVRLKDDQRFGTTSDFEQLPGKLSGYLKTSADQIHLNLNGIGYAYQLAGTCTLPGSGAVHIVYHKQNDPDQSISVWIVPARPEHDALEENRVYTEASDNLLRPVIFWRDGGLLYYLVGDSIEDCDKAVQQLRQAV